MGTILHAVAFGYGFTVGVVIALGVLGFVSEATKGVFGTIESLIEHIRRARRR